MQERGRADPSICYSRHLVNILIVISGRKRNTDPLYYSCTTYTHILIIARYYHVLNDTFTLFLHFFLRKHSFHTWEEARMMKFLMYLSGMI